MPLTRNATPAPSPPATAASTVDQLATLGWELNASQYRVVHLAARYDTELDWFHSGLKSAATGICQRLQIHSSTAREWIRVGHALRQLPRIDAAFKANTISYAKARIVSRWAEPHNELQLLDLALVHTANRLTTLVAKALAENDDNDELRDQRQHHDRAVTSYTDGDGMVVVRVVLPPGIAKPVLAAIDELVRRIAETPSDIEAPVVAEDEPAEPAASADASQQQSVAPLPVPTTERDQDASADASARDGAQLARTLRELRRRWQPEPSDTWSFPTLAQQRADALVALFLGRNINLTTEVIIHVRGEGNTFDDGTPLSSNAITRQLDDAYIRLMIHDTNRTPLDASNRRRHPTTRQKRVVLETHNHQCVECASTDLLELDHNPPHHQTHHTITTELEPRCAPCHRARHRIAA